MSTLTATYDANLKSTKPVYSIEFFHIYTDETINDSHKASLNYLNAAREAWNVDADLVILIDNYNPTSHTLSVDGVFDYLAESGYPSLFYAYEADMVSAAQALLDSLTSAKLRKKYLNYINGHGKYPCSLLTAAWYLTRLGVFSQDTIKARNMDTEIRPADRLLSVLPKDYREVEMKALKLIKNSEWSHCADKIQALFYPEGSHRKVDLF